MKRSIKNVGTGFVLSLVGLEESEKASGSGRTVTEIGMDRWEGIMVRR